MNILPSEVIQNIINYLTIDLLQKKFVLLSKKFHNECISYFEKKRKERCFNFTKHRKLFQISFLKTQNILQIHIIYPHFMLFYLKQTEKSSRYQILVADLFNPKKVYLQEESLKPLDLISLEKTTKQPFFALFKDGEIFFKHVLDEDQSFVFKEEGEKITRVFVENNQIRIVSGLKIKSYEFEPGKLTLKKSEIFKPKPLELYDGKISYHVSKKSGRYVSTNWTLFVTNDLKDPYKFQFSEKLEISNVRSIGFEYHTYKVGNVKNIFKFDNGI